MVEFLILSGVLIAAFGVLFITDAIIEIILKPTRSSGYKADDVREVIQSTHTERKINHARYLRNRYGAVSGIRWKD